MGGRIVGAVILAEEISTLTGFPTRVLVQELHSTKGWKPVYWRRWNSFHAPVIGAFHWESSTRPHQRKQATDAMFSRVVVGDQYCVSHKALMRHSWYRRKMRKQQEAAALASAALQLNGLDVTMEVANAAQAEL